MSRADGPTSRKDLEVQIVRAMIHFEKEFMGRGPLDTRAYLLGDLILVRLKGVLTPAERKLSESQSDRSAYLLKQVRNELLESGRPLLEAVVQDIVGVPVCSVHSDICIQTGERVFVFSLARSPLNPDGECNAEAKNFEEPRRARAKEGNVAMPIPQKSDNLKNNSQPSSTA